MRIAQIGIFMLGVIAFVVAAFFTGEETGDTLWRVGIAAMVSNLVLVKLRPATRS